MPARLALWCLALTAAIPLAAGCASSSPARRSTPASAVPGATSTAPAATSTAPAGTSTAPSSSSTVPAAPGTARYTPAAPQSSPDAAAAALISDWGAGSRARAASVAAPAAVDALFGQPYPSGYMQPRGCTDAATDPGTCTYANRQTGSLYEIAVTRFGGGWYVSEVTVES